MSTVKGTMHCCLNTACHNPSEPDGTKFCSHCGVPLVILRNHYRPIKSLGAGEFGKTYLAEDIDKLGEKCVIKQFAPQTQKTGALQKATELFELEAIQLQKLGENPQIPTLLAYFQENNRLYLIQQFIDGHNLLERLQHKGTYSEKDTRELLEDLLNILKVVHQYKVIHRDIKPENIIQRGDSKVVLIDFGASKQLQNTIVTKKEKGTMIGSSGYAPSEQMQGGEAYPASDLYSLGATCFHLLSGIHPWELWESKGYGWVENWRNHLKKPVSQEFGQILDKLLQEDYRQRYHSVEKVLQDLSVKTQEIAQRTIGFRTHPNMLTQQFEQTYNQLQGTGNRLLNYLLEIRSGRHSEGDDTPGLQSVEEDINKALTALKEQNYQVAVIAAMKAGKSTFLNALIGADVLASESEACTVCRTDICPIDASQIPRLLEYQEGKRKPLVLVEGEAEKIRQAFLGRTRKIRETNNPDNTIRFELEYPIEAISKIPSLAGFRLIDTPGPNEWESESFNTTALKQTALEALRTCDAILFILDYTSFKDNTNSELLKDLIEQRSELLKQDREKIYFILNKVDRKSVKDREIPDVIKD